MQRWNDEQRKEWMDALKEAERQLQGDCPLWEEAQLVSADEHIKYLEYHIAGLTAIMERHMVRVMSKEELDKLVNETIEGERK